MSKISQDTINYLLSRAVTDVIVKKDLEKKLQSGKVLRIKHGVDPTTSDLHIGHAVAYWKMKQLQDLGHKIVFLIGDFTGRFGDPTEKLSERNLRTKDEVLKLAEKYLEQVGKILDMSKTEIRYNSEWYDKMSAEEMLRIMSHFTVLRMLERDMFDKRIKKNIDIRLHEPVYPVLQGYDSVMLQSDLTVCGSDQIFNELRGRDLQIDFKQPPQDILAVELLPGIDGNMKMSQSLKNEISINDSAQQKYGKVMSVNDNLIIKYFKLATLLSDEEITIIEKDLEKSNPRDIKARLAHEITALYHGSAEAQKAASEFDKIFKEKQTPTNIETKKIISQNILEIICDLKLAQSKAEARRLVEQGGVKIDGQVISDWQSPIELEKEKILQVGKRKFVRIKK
jgi:tyrosyl-tRNA synthetase